ncbi:hypothetical protein GCM10023143_30040 [Compostibacter hankyongensis]|uniref:RES domain-containing protein n=2 Tax=Compostibacter hankyongensis TaxID=1007089 RepID=A0ABP8G5A7_9BACT
MRGHVYLEYSFHDSGKIYKGKKYEELYPGESWRFLNRDFSVLYSSKDPTQSVLLVTPNSFFMFGLPFPDSLNWVKDCELKSAYNRKKKYFQFWDY